MGVTRGDRNRVTSCHIRYNPVGCWRYSVRSCGGTQANLEGMKKLIVLALLLGLGVFAAQKFRST